METRNPPHNDAEGGKQKFEMTGARQTRFRKKLQQTIWLLTATFGVGAAINVRGPALLDLQRSTGSSISQITAAVFVTIALGWAGGSLVGGVLYDRYQKQLVIGISLLLSSVFTGILPWCTNIIALAFIVLISGGFLSSSITGIGAMLLKIWGDEAAVYLQTQEFFYSIGGVIGILILEAFTKSKTGDYKSVQTCERRDTVSTNSGHLMNATLGIQNLTGYNVTHNTNDTHVNGTDASDFEYVYLIISGFLFLSAAPFFIYYMRKIDLTDFENATDGDKGGENIKEASNIPTTRLKFVIIALVLVVYFFFVGATESFYGLMTTFTVGYLCWDRSLGNLIPSLTWGVTGVVQLLSIAIAKVIKPARILIFCVTLMISASLVLVIAVDKSDLTMWIVAAVYAIGSAPVFPNTLSWFNHHVEVTGTLMAIVQIAVGLGAVLIPFLIGWLFENTSKIWYVYMVFICLVVCGMSFVALIPLGVRFEKMKQRLRKDDKKLADNGETELIVLNHENQTTGSEQV